MAHLMHDLASWFKLEEIDIDNWMFKLYYRASALLCMTGATVGIATQYFGDPIRWVRDINNNDDNYNIIILFF